MSGALPRPSATRFLTAEEKAYEIATFAEYRQDPQGYRTAHPQARGGEGYIDPEVLPLVDALNGLEGVCTVQSCCGHLGLGPTGTGSHPGQLWMRLSEGVNRGVEELVGELLVHDEIEHAQKLYSYRSGRVPHEVFDVQWRAGALEEAQRIILDFFERVVADQEKRDAQFSADYYAVLDAIGISADGAKREIEKIKVQVRRLIESGGKDRNLVPAIEKRLNLLERSLDVPDLTKHRMAKREGARRSQQRVLEEKLRTMKAVAAELETMLRGAVWAVEHGQALSPRELDLAKAALAQHERAVA